MAKDKGPEETIVAEESPPVVDDVAAKLRQLGAELVAVADDKLARDAKLREVESVLGNLKIKDFEELADSPTIQNFVSMFADTSKMRPGEVKNRGSLAEVEREWTWNDVNAAIRNGEMKLKTFYPSETLTLTWNGLSVQVIANHECEVPMPFFNIYDEHMKAMEQSRIHEQYLLGMSDQPPHPNWQTPEGAVVRAFSVQGRRFGRASGYIGTGPLRPGDEGEETNA